MPSASYPSAYDSTNFVGNTTGMANLGDTSSMGPMRNTIGGTFPRTYKRRTSKRRTYKRRTYKRRTY